MPRLIAKLIEQRRYALWRQTIRPPGRPRNSFSTEGVLPETDSGEQTARRWRLKLGHDDNFLRALDDTKLRCLRMCEQGKIGTVRGTEGTGEFELYTPARLAAETEHGSLPAYWTFLTVRRGASSSRILSSLSFGRSK
jgi:hypothetical protein